MTQTVQILKLHSSTSSGKRIVVHVAELKMFKLDTSQNYKPIDILRYHFTETGDRLFPTHNPVMGLSDTNAKLHPLISIDLI